MKILIVDDEPEIVEIIEFLVTDYLPTGSQTLLAHSGHEATKLLAEDPSIDLCICDHNMPNGMGSLVLKYIIDNGLNTKFVLCSTVIPSDKPLEYPNDRVFSNIQKPDIGAGVLKLSNLLSDRDSVIHSIAMGEFVPVSVHVLLMMGKIPADIYLRMSDNKYVKCMNKFDHFTIEDGKKYNSKSIAEFFVKKSEETKAINAAILSVIEKIMDKRKLPLSEKMSIAHNQIVGLIKFTGITPELAAATKKNIDQSVALLMKSPVINDFWKEMNLLGEYPSKLYSLQSMLSSVIVKKLHWYSEATMFKLTLSSFLQDVTLDSIALMELCDYQEFLSKESQFSRAEIKKYNDHPQRAVEIAAAFREIPPDIDRILFEQHEMPNGNGFPRKLNAHQLGSLSCVFILTGIFARYILREGNHFDLSTFILEMEQKGYSRGNFKEAFEVIKSFKK